MVYIGYNSLQPPASPPQSEQQLLNNANAIAGLTLGDLADMAGITTPINFKRDKGWTGQLIELWLGASAGSKAEQDFPHLGVELKTIPVNHQGLPLETTYVCYAPLLSASGISWRDSNVYNKLQKVLWVPVQGERDILPKHRVVGTPFIWQPSEQELSALALDWEEIMELIALGKIETITARIGECLQLRPKAADGSALTDAIGEHGGLIKTRPRGFYLRKQFTLQLLQRAFSQ